MQLSQESLNRIPDTRVPVSREGSGVVKGHGQPRLPGWQGESPRRAALNA